MKWFRMILFIIGFVFLPLWVEALGYVPLWCYISVTLLLLVFMASGIGITPEDLERR